MKRAVLIAALVMLGGLGGCGTDRAPDTREATALYLPGFVGVGPAGGHARGAVTVVDGEAGTTRVVELPQLGVGDASHWLVRRGHRLVFWGGDTIYSIDLALESPPQELGRADPFMTFIPSAHPNRVWLIAQPNAVEAVREVTADGRVTVPDVRPPHGRAPVGSVGDYLVFDSGRGTWLWDPATREVRLRFPASFAAGATHGHLLSRCGEDGDPLHLTDVETRRDDVIPLPADAVSFDCFDAAFSPDGDTLAVPIFLERGRSHQRADSEPRTALALVEVERRSVSIVRGTRLRRGYVFVAWSSSGDSVFMSGGGTGRREIVEYEIGAERASRLRVEVHDFFGMAAN